MLAVILVSDFVTFFFMVDWAFKAPTQLTDLFAPHSPTPPPQSVLRAAVDLSGLDCAIATAFVDTLSQQLSFSSGEYHLVSPYQNVTDGDAVSALQARDFFYRVKRCIRVIIIVIVML